METDIDKITKNRQQILRNIKGIIFRSILLVATLIGIVSLFILMIYVFSDAINPLSGEIGWYLAYFITIILPMLGFLFYALRDPDIWGTSIQSFGVLFGVIILAIMSYTIPQTLNPYDIFVYFLTISIPITIVTVYGYNNPKATWTGTLIPIVAVFGLFLGFIFFDSLEVYVDIVEEWIVYLFIIGIPISISLWIITKYVISGFNEKKVSLYCFGFTTIIGLLGIFLGYNSSLGVIFFSTIIFPLIFYISHNILNNKEGRIGLVSPLILILGIFLGLTITGQLELSGPESWLNINFLTASFSSLNPREAGIYPQVIGSILIVVLMAIVIFPVGIGAAIYLEEYAPKTGFLGRITQFIELNISNLAGVPSVVYGLLGLGLVINGLNIERGLLLVASITLGLLILPIVIVSSQEAIRSVPDSFRQGSYGVGGSKWQTLKNIVLPEAMPGILTGTILALGRAIGETAPLIIIGLSTTQFSPPSGIMEKATALPLQIYAIASYPQPEYRYGVVAAGVVVLLTLMLIMNAIAIILRNKYQR